MNGADRPARWLVVELPVPERLRYDVSASLIQHGLDAVQETASGVRVYLRSVDHPERRIRSLLERVEADVPDLPDVDFEWSTEDDADWSALWRQGLEARRPGERIWIAPSWSLPALAPGELLVVVDPAMAFGTGEHGTTRGCIRLLEGIPMDGRRVLDIGTGTGVLAVAAALLGAESVLAVDNDREATDNATRTVSSNGVAAKVTVDLADVDSTWLETAGTFDAIVANVLSGVLRPLLPALACALEPGGRLILSGILAEESDGMRADALDAGLRVIAEDREDEWWSALFERG